MPMKTAYERLVSAAFVLALALVLGVGTFSYNAIRGAIAADHGRDEARQLLVALRELVACMKDAETGQRGYLLTGDNAYLEPYTAARDAFPQRIAAVRARLGSAPDSLVRFQALESVAREKMAELAEAIRAYRDAGFNAAQAVVKTGRGKHAMDEIRKEASRVETQTVAAWEAEARKASVHLRATLIGVAAGGTLGASILLIAFFLLRREIRLHQKLNRELDNRVSERTEDLRITMESIGDAVLATDQTGAITLLNREAERITGWPASEALGQPLEKVFVTVNEDTRVAAENPATRAMREGLVVGLANHTVLVARDGVERPIEDSAAPIRARKGDVRGVILVFRDVTEAREARRKVEKSEEQLRLLVEQAPVSVAMFDREMNYIATSRRWAADYGRGYDNLTGLNHYEVNPDIPDRWREAHQLALAGTPQTCNEDQWILSDGRERWLRWAVHPWRDNTQEIGGIIASAEDITEQKQAEQALRDSERRLSGILSSAMDAIITVDARQTVVFFNPAAERVFGCSAAEAIGGSLDRFIPLRFRHAHSGHVERFGKTGTTSRQMGALGLIFGLRANGEEFPMEASISHVEVGGTQFYTVILRDITARKQAEDELRAAKLAAEDAKLVAETASRAKDDFLAALSHELRTPLTPVLLLADSMEHAPDVPEELRADFSLIRKNVQLEARLIDDLLDLTRITHGKLHLDFEVADAHLLLRQSLEFFQDELRNRNHAFTFDLAAAECHVRGDVVRLQQVFWNVIKNAVKFTPPGGRICIRSSNGIAGSATARHLHVEIADTGMGIAAEDMSRIFHAFAQGEEANSHRFGGLGLGLSISRVIIEEHCGKIWAESAGPGQGTTVHIEIPLADSELAPPVKVAPPAIALESLRILLVEDNDPTRITLVRLLQRRGHSVSAAATLVEARGLANNQEFDLIISDLGLPDGSGYDLMKEVRRDHGTPGIALSGYGMEEDIRRSHESGFFDHLTKPVDMAAMDRAISHVHLGGHCG